MPENKDYVYWYGLFGEGVEAVKELLRTFAGSGDDDVYFTHFVFTIYIPAVRLIDGCRQHGC